MVGEGRDCREEVLVWGGGDGSKGQIFFSPDLELVTQQQLVSAPL